MSSGRASAKGNASGRPRRWGRRTILAFVLGAPVVSKPSRQRFVPNDWAWGDSLARGRRPHRLWFRHIVRVVREESPSGGSASQLDWDGKRAHGAEANLRDDWCTGARDGAGPDEQNPWTASLGRSGPGVLCSAAGQPAYERSITLRHTTCVRQHGRCMPDDLRAPGCSPRPE